MPIWGNFPSTRNRSTEDELMESPSVKELDFIQALNEIRWVNRYLGGTAAMLSTLQALCAGMPEQQEPIRILDLGTGSADIPIAIAQWGRAHKQALQITAIDLHTLAVQEARHLTRQYPEIEVCQDNALELPYEAQSFDYVVSSMFMHHLTHAEAICLLQNMARLCRRGLIVNDLERHPLAWWGIRLLGNLTGKGPIFKNDSALSVLRGFQKQELIALCQEADLAKATITHRHPYRWLLTWEKQESAN
jgi:2-polyprenyl-3-methyl-5-hydroxy-6-metoxy-1,4-benzoquinol methylase